MPNKKVTVKQRKADAPDELEDVEMHVEDSGDAVVIAMAQAGAADHVLHGTFVEGDASKCAVQLDDEGFATVHYLQNNPQNPAVHVVCASKDIDAQMRLTERETVKAGDVVHFEAA